MAGFAPAKVNLTLHVIRQRSDGYHLLDSLVMFASVGDELHLRASDALGLTVTGPQAEGVPVDGTNSILKAAARFLPQGKGAQFELVKNLPSAAGIGGGTADAAAALRLIHEKWPDGPAQSLFSDVAQAAELGADVPVCLHSKPARMRGIGEQVEQLEGLPTLHAVLVNPRVAMATPAVFKAMASKENPAMDALPEDVEFTQWLAHQRNDMQPAAVRLTPVIGDVLAAIDQTQSCTLARMSGSGATCFGLYPNAHVAKAAGIALSATHPDWWIAPCTLN